MFITEVETPCQVRSPELWFAKPGTRTTQYAKRFCYECPVRRDCLDAAVTFERKIGHTQHGVYGGLDEKERLAFLKLPVAVSVG